MSLSFNNRKKAPFLNRVVCYLCGNSRRIHAVFIYVCALSLRAGNAAVIVFVVGHDVIAQQTGKNRKFLTSFSSLPRPLSLAHIGWPVHCNSLFLREAPAQGLGQRTTDALHCAHALLRGRIITPHFNKIRFTVLNGQCGL